MKNPSSKSYQSLFEFLNVTMLLCFTLFLGIIITGESFHNKFALGSGALFILIYSTTKIYFTRGVWPYMDEFELIFASITFQKVFIVFTVTIYACVMFLTISLSFNFSELIFRQKSSLLWFVVCGFIYLAYSLPALFIALSEPNHEIQ